MALIPAAWLPECKMQRVHSHWTGGTHTASELEKEHYHILIQGDGTLVRGNPSIKDNAAPITERYAAHTLHANSGAIGISCCAMLDAESARNPGRFPLTEKQWDVSAQVAAELCERYGIPVTSVTVLQHSEVQHNLGIAQRAKWDVSVMPWAPALTAQQVYDDYRARVARHMTVHETTELPPTVLVQVLGASLPGIMIDGLTAVALRPLLDARKVTGAQIVGTGVAARATVTYGNSGADLPLYIVAGTGYVPCRMLATLMGQPIEWNPATRTVVIG